MNPQLPCVGETLGARYELLDTLGEGGMSVVFRARDRSTGADVALKLLTPRYLGRPERAQRLLDEAGYLEQLRGAAGIVTLIDHGHFHGHFAEREGWPYLVTELLEGRALHWLLIKHELGPADVRELALGIARALASCHAAGIVHRDLTPSNVFVVLDPIRVKLFDFSHASAAVDTAPISPGDSGRLTGIFDVPGTSGYMGPEQASSSAADPKMDVFAFGVLLYEIITGRNPYPQVSHAEFIELQRSGNLEPPRLAAWAYEADPVWADVIRDCTLADPGARPSVEELVLAIEKIQALAPGGEGAEEEEQTQRLDAEKLARLQAGLRQTAPVPKAKAEAEAVAVAKPVRSVSGAIGAWNRRPDGLVGGGWGPPPSQAVAEHAAGHESAPAPAPTPTPESAVAPAPAASSAPVPGSAPELAARPAPAPDEPQRQPAFARVDAKPIQLPPMPASAQVDDDDDTPPPLSRPRRWLPALLLIGLISAAGVGLAAWSVSSSVRERSPAPVAEDAPKQQAHAVPPAILEQEAPDAEVAETGGSLVEQPRPAAPEQAEPPELEPVPAKPEAKPPGTPKPKPEAKPACTNVELAAEQAKAQRDWSAVIRHTATQRCWADNQTRLRLRVEALAQAKRWDACLELAQASDDPELTRWVKFCAKNL